MPVKVEMDGNPTWIHPTTTWKKHNGKISGLQADPNFYITLQKIN
jgi:hypothetical protein